MSLNDNLFGQYFVSYTSSVKRTQSEVVSTIGGRNYVVLPNVLAFVQSYFSCSDGVTGGLLEDDGIFYFLFV